ncbi:MAG TPA: FAD-dependent monooxygenase [Gemmataceae bacterium]|nr:FAD-dependent monooxygenase [Gemmataceae bacterium]
MTVAATLGLEEAAGRCWDVVVVGAGPAGALAARELARRGVAVLCVDRASFPRWKVCGSCLNLRALATLTAVGLHGLPGRLGAIPLDSLRLAAGGRQACVALPGGVSLSRERLDAALVEAAVTAGAAFLPRTQARLGRATAAARQVYLHQDGRSTAVSARLVLAADGLAGKLVAGEAAVEAASASRIGAGVITEAVPDAYGTGTIFMGCGAGGYVGMVRLEDGRLDVAAAFDPVRAKRAGGIGKAAVAVLDAAGLPPVPGLADLPWRGTPLLTRRLMRPAAERVLVLGDAAGYVEPFTGEGIAWALASAAAVAPLAARDCRRWESSVASEWSLLYRQTVARRQVACRVVAGVLRRPVLTRTVVAVLARAPGLAVPLVRYLNTARFDVPPAPFWTCAGKSV